MKSLLNLLLITILITSPSIASATSGACSSHKGVNCAYGPTNDGHVMCIDGWTNSSVFYKDTEECRVAPNGCKIQYLTEDEYNKKVGELRSLIQKVEVTYNSYHSQLEKNKLQINAQIQNIKNQQEINTTYQIEAARQRAISTGLAYYTPQIADSMIQNISEKSNSNLNYNNTAQNNIILENDKEDQRARVESLKIKMNIERDISCLRKISAQISNQQSSSLSTKTKLNPIVNDATKTIVTTQLSGENKFFGKPSTEIATNEKGPIIVSYEESGTDINESFISRIWRKIKFIFSFD